MLDFIDIGPRRERLQNQNYNIDSYYRSALVQKPQKEGGTTHVRR